ncbi:MAG: DUF4326 domain-containing protein [Treponema sp.]|jgi:hypothetical protein|nr:DUF4326 domain-containing protein [Treponema sp.]
MGNPFTRPDAVEKYKKFITTFPLPDEMLIEWVKAGGTMRIYSLSANGNAYIKAELRGKDLACWCPLAYPDGKPYPCHADILLEIANGDQI